tara:strand:+ start:154 stop:852 length:699 start_codon:yes stop_codon:yes gene_type:complete
MRINKFLAHCGVDSRRKCERYILDARVTVNGNIITDLAFIIHANDKVEVDGNRVSIPTNYEYYILHKPKGYICSNSDELGRKNVTELIKTNHRLYSVGRLDKDTTGLLILTDDGDFTNRVLHPKHRIERKYYAYTKDKLSLNDILKIKKGIFLSKSERVQADIKYIDYVKGKHKWRIILKEGKNREIRRIFLRFNIKVYNLHRYAFGGLTLKGIDKGKSKKIAYQVIESMTK